MKEVDVLATKIDLLLSGLNERAHEKKAMRANIFFEQNEGQRSGHRLTNDLRSLW
jgi:hypothetical protein